MPGYWSSLWLRPDFAHKTLKNCVKIIHLDIVEIWNMNDKNKVWFPWSSVVLVIDWD
jgi:hypothetical protein